MGENDDGRTDDASATPLTDFRFGAIAAWGGLVTTEALDEALAEQAERRSRGERPARIGEMLVERGHLTEEGVRRVLRVQLQRMPAEGHVLFGRIAVARGFATEDAVALALDVQSREMLAEGGASGAGGVRRLGEILVSAGDIRPSGVEAILTYQANADTVPMSEARRRPGGTPSAEEAGTPEGEGAPSPVEAPGPGEAPSSKDGARSEEPPPAGRAPFRRGEGPAFLPRGVAGFALDHSTWIVAALAVALAVVLATFREAIFG